MKAFENPIYVTRPMVPNLNDMLDKLNEIFDSKFLTNNGNQLLELEDKLKKKIKSPYLSLINNGTTALLIALKALKMNLGEIITTPFTFPATVNSIAWSGFDIVFCDIDDKNFCIDTEKLESLINEKTRAILAVHIFGYSCEVDKINRIAEKHKLKVIYDAAHTFLSQISDQPIENFGDITMLSFHATKMFHTIEGGCLICNNAELDETIKLMRNFGIKNEEEIVDTGINGKMNEIQAAIGLLNLEVIDEEILKRKEIISLYISQLKDIQGIKIRNTSKKSFDIFQFFPIQILENEFGNNRNYVYNKLKEYNIYTRKYFNPLCSEYPQYQNLDSSCPKNLKVANKLKDEILCLPLYGDLGLENTEKICDIIKMIQNHNL